MQNPQNPYLTPSHIRHTGKFCCSGRRVCYHPAIRVVATQKTWRGNQIIWSSNSCAGSSRNTAEGQAQEYLDLVRKRVVWPRDWNRPDNCDISVLHNKDPNQVRYIKAQTLQAENNPKIKQAALTALEDFKRDKGIASPKPSMSILDILTRKGNPAPGKENAPEPTNSLDIAPPDEYVAGMFGDSTTQEQTELVPNSTTKEEK